MSVDCQGKCDNCEPLGSATLTSLKHNTEPLLDLIDHKFDILDKMLADGVITARHKEYIDAGSKDSEKNARMLDIIKRRNVAQFNKFAEIVGENQTELIKILHRGGEPLCFTLTAYTYGSLPLLPNILCCSLMLQLCL